MHLHFSGPAFETLGAVPAICKGVMYYRTLNRTSKLYLARAHLSIRIDEWPHEPFSRPMDFPEDQIADVWIPPSLETTALQVVKLQTACAPVRKPPHADISECSSMALQLALPPSGPDGDCLHGEADGADVRGHIHEAKDEGPSAGSLLPKADGHDHADGDDRCPDSAQQPAELPERSSHLSSRQRLAKLRRWRQEDDHLRSMRCSLDPEHRQGQVIDPTGEERVPPAHRRHRPSKILNGDGQKIFNKGMGKLIGWCTAVALALTETGQAQDHSILSLSPPQSPQLGPATAGDGRGCQHAKLGGSGSPLYATATTEIVYKGEHGLLSEHSSGRRPGDARGPQWRDGVASSSTPGAKDATIGGAGGAGVQRGRRAGVASHPRCNPCDNDRRRAGGSGRRGGVQLKPNALTLQGSADAPLLKEDRGWMPLRAGQQKRLL